MDKKKFEAVLTLLIPQVINLIAENYNFDEEKRTGIVTFPEET